MPCAPILRAGRSARRWRAWPRRRGRCARCGPRWAAVETIFFGGGTPSVLPPAAIGRILDTVARHYDVAPDAEISMEANPGTITEANFRGYRAAGVNRLSMGVQSFDDAQLRGHRAHPHGGGSGGRLRARAAGRVRQH